MSIGLMIARADTWKSSGALNPAMAIGLELWLATKNNLDYSFMFHAYVFIIGPLLGAFIASKFVALYIYALDQS